MKKIYGNDIFVTQVKFSYSSITKLNRLNIGAAISNYSRKFKIFVNESDLNIDMGKRYYTDGVRTIKLNDDDKIPEGYSLVRTFKVNP